MSSSINTVRHSDGIWMTAIRLSGCRTVFGCGLTKLKSIEAAERRLYAMRLNGVL